MKNTPLERRKRTKAALNYYEKNGKLGIFEPCNCGSRIMHNNGGNYHREIYLKREKGIDYIKQGTTCELSPDPEWEKCDDFGGEIEAHSDWLECVEAYC